jgi:hypothetical protein
MAFQSVAAIPVNLYSNETAVKFFKNPQSLFPSGETNRSNLEKSLRKEHLESSYLVQRGASLFWVDALDLARDLQLSELVELKATKKIYRIKSISSYQAELIDNDGSSMIASLKEISPVSTDTGLAMALIPTQIRQFPSWKADAILSVPAGSRLQIVRFDDTWALVNFESVGKVSGWVDMSNLLFKFDFASFVQKKGQSSWIKVLHRQGAEMVTESGDKIAMQKLSGILTKPNLGISLTADDKNSLSIRQNLTIMDQDAEPWNISELKDFGLVYWKKPQSSNQPPTPVSMTNDELLKREIFSASFHPNNPKVGAVSAKGIFVTENGTDWRQISRFKNVDQPVLIDESGNLLVGNLRSADMGRTFHPYFRWEPLAQLLENRQKSPAYRLKIKKISKLKPGFFRFEVETQRGPLFLAAKMDRGFINHWSFD